MKNLRIFLTSDIHLGLKFSGYPEIQKELADARFETLEKCVSRANDEKCHIFAVGGDMFDKVTVAKRDVVRAAQVEHPAPAGARVLYATQGATDPPTFTLFANRELPKTWLRYLERRLREDLSLGSTPIKLRVRRRSE